MVYLSQQQVRYQDDTVELQTLLDPAVLQAARQIYHTYYEVHPERPDRPLGIAIDRLTYRGQLIFGQKRPALLPRECFVSLQQLESNLY